MSYQIPLVLIFYGVQSEIHDVQTKTRHVGRCRHGYRRPLPAASDPFWGRTMTTTKKQTTANDLQVGGAHYKGRAIQPWDYIAGNEIPYLAGNAIKYLSRYRDKNGAEDIRKAIHYCQKILEVEYGDAKGL